MRKILLSLLLFGGTLASCLAQTPDCTFTVAFTSAAAQSPAISNKPTTAGGAVGCTSWIVAYWTTGASGVSVQIEGAPDPGTGHPPTSGFTALTATSNSANPATGTAQGGILACCDYYPWIRINPSTFTGTGKTMTVRVSGWRGTANVAQGGGGGGGGTIMGTIAANQLAFGTAPDTIGGSSAFTVDPVNGLMTITPGGTGTALTVNGDSAGDDAIDAFSSGALNQAAVYGQSTDTDGLAVPVGLKAYAAENDSTGSDTPIFGIISNASSSGSNANGDVTGVEVIVTSYGSILPANIIGFSSVVGGDFSVTGIAAAFEASDWGLGNFAYHNSGQSLAQPEGTVIQANLGTVPVGAFVFCSDCTIATCAGSGGGAWVFGTAAGNVCPF